MRLIRGRDGWWCLAPAGVALASEAFVRDGMLTPGGMAEVSRLGLLEARTPASYGLTVLTSTACNLGCPYCFQNSGTAEAGRFDPPRIRRAVLDLEVVDATVEFTRQRMADLGVSRLQLLLFGGEPLLNPLWCRSLLERCAKLGSLAGSMVSNGVLLDRRQALRLATAGLQSMQITLDGPRDVHDRIRVTRAGRRTFDRILGNVAAAQDTTDIRFTLRVNVTPAALLGLGAMTSDIAAVVDARRCGFTIAPVRDYGTGFADVIAASRRDSDLIVAAYALAQDLGFRITAPSEQPCAFCSHQRGRYGAVVNADGALYSSWESAGRPGYQVGSVATGYTDYADDKWVRCGDLAGPTDPPPPTAFLDRIDAARLDLIRDRQRSGRAAGRQQPESQSAGRG